MMTHKYWLTTACAVALLSACSDDEVTDTANTTITWRSCTDTPTLQCATLSVPMNYAEPETRSIDIGLTRLPATEPSANEALLLNPGGPGASGNELLEIFTELETIPAAVREKYDLIGFDPRGIGSSTAVECDAFGLDDINDYLTDQNAIDTYLQQTSAIYQQCMDKHGDYLQHLGSLNVVRDMESIRKALNVEKMNFIGYSYGTRLAALYLQTYPEQSGRMVLDGSISPESGIQTLAQGGLGAVQANLESLLGDCTRLVDDCDPQALLNKLQLRVDETLSNPDSEEEFLLLGNLVFQSVLDPEFGGFFLGPLLSYLDTNDVTVLEDFVQLLESQGFDIDDDDDENTVAQIGVICADDGARSTAADLQSTLVDYNETSDLFAELYVSVAAACTGWPASLEPLELITTRTAPRSLVIGGTSDAQTPLNWSREMADSIGGYFVESEHPGHTSVYNEKSACVDQLVTQFLVQGTLPDTQSCGS